MEKIKKIIPNIGDEELKALAALMTAEYEKGKADEASRRGETERAEKLDAALTEAGAKNLTAVKALLGQDAESDETALKKRIDELKAECAYLFEFDKPQFTASPGIKRDTKNFETMGYKKRLKLFSENPELYRELANR